MILNIYTETDMGYKMIGNAVPVNLVKEVVVILEKL